MYQNQILGLSAFLVVLGSSGGRRGDVAAVTSLRGA